MVDADLEIITCLEYEYAQVAVDLFCENVTLVYCLVVVCNQISQFFLYFDECCNFEIWIHSSVWLDKRDKVNKHKSTA